MPEAILSENYTAYIAAAYLLAALIIGWMWVHSARMEAKTRRALERLTPLTPPLHAQSEGRRKL